MSKKRFVSAMTLQPDDAETGVVILPAEKSEVNSESSKSSHNPHKRPRVESYANSGHKMSLGDRLMQKAGYTGSGGLGSRQQGITEAIGASDQISTFGIGFKSGFEQKTHKYVPFGAVIRIPIVYMDPFPGLVPTDFTNWLSIGKRSSETISDKYCSVDIQETLAAGKTLFDSVDSKTFVMARNRGNPFEDLKREMFMNRAALKMAEMDKICDRIFTSPPCWRHEQKQTGKRKLVLFGDICSGPGGFSEYMLSKLKWRGRGFGFTLRGNLDFKLTKFNDNAPTQSFSTHYGVDNTGDITKTENVRHFAKEVLDATTGHGLHVILADGGFDFSGRENFQELLCRQLLLGQVVTALSTLGKGGVFLCKVFDTFLPFTVQILHILRVHFEKFALLKPNQSRPANSERYVVCVGLRQQNPPVIEYLHSVNMKMNEFKAGVFGAIGPGKGEISRQQRLNNTTDNDEKEEVSANSKNKKALDEEEELMVTGLVPEEYMDEAYKTYVKQFSTEFATRQIKALTRLKHYVEDPNLRQDDSHKIRLDCLSYWELKEHPFTKEHDRDPLTKAYYDAHEQTGWFLEKDIQFGIKILSRLRPHYFIHDQAKQWFATYVIAEVQKMRPLAAFQSCVKEEKDRIWRAISEQKHVNSSLLAQFSEAARQVTMFLPPLARARDWSAFVTPARSKRYVLLSAYHGVYLYNPTGNKIENWPIEFPVTVLPPDTILDVIVAGKYVYVLDGWSLPDQTKFYSQRPRFQDRQELLGLFVAAHVHNAPNLKMAISQPMSSLMNLPTFRALSSAFKASGAKPPASSVEFDVYFVRGQGKPSPWIYWQWQKDQVRDVRQFIKFVLDMNSMLR